MTRISHQEWLRRAFLFAEAALNQEIITPRRVCMTEDYFRSAFVRGLLSAKPDLAHLVRSEHTATWSSNSCHFCACTQGRGRPIQHDVAILPSAYNPGVVCEVKWAKRPSAEGIAKDIWKLLITRGDEPERQAWRCYLLIGGEQPAFSDTLNQLRTSGINLRYSSAGRGETKTNVQVNLVTFLSSNLGKKSLAALTGWGPEKGTIEQSPKSDQTLSLPGDASLGFSELKALNGALFFMSCIALEPLARQCLQRMIFTRLCRVVANK